MIRWVLSLFLFVSLLTSATADAKTVFKVADTVAASEIVNQVLEQTAQNLKKASNGEIEMKLYPGGQLGGEKDLVEQMALGTLEVAVSGWVGLPAFSAVYLPYVFKDDKQMLAALRGDLGDLLSKTWMEKQGVSLLAYMVRSPRQLTSKKPVKEPADIKGVKIRVPQVDLFIGAWEAVGALPTSISFPELFNALQSGVAEAQENPVELIYASKFFEVQKCITLINYIRAPYFLGVNNKWWSGLPPEHREMITKEFRKAEDDMVIRVEQQQSEFISKLKAEGMEVIEPDTEQWKNMMYPKVTVPYAAKAWGPDMLKTIQTKY